MWTPVTDSKIEISIINSHNACVTRKYYLRCGQVEHGDSSSASYDRRLRQSLVQNDDQHENRVSRQIDRQTHRSQLFTPVLDVDLTDFSQDTCRQEPRDNEETKRGKVDECRQLDQHVHATRT